MQNVSKTKLDMRRQAIRIDGMRLLLIAIVIANADTASAADTRYCSKTANTLYSACQGDITDNYWTARSRCINFTNEELRNDCLNEAKESLRAEKLDCRTQRTARKQLCLSIGEARYQPDFRPSNFVNPADIGTSVAPNPFFSLIVGTHRVYKGSEEVITVDVTEKTKLIEGVTCRVVTDVVKVNGNATEITEDWFAQDLAGNVWYCGEISQELETFVGDVPAEAEVTAIDGSWKAGRDGAEPGIIMPAVPHVGLVYREEQLFGEAEDAAEVVSVTDSATSPAASCNGTCIVTRNFTPLHPGVNEFKYYTAGIGLILEVEPDGSRVELVEYNNP